MSRDAEKLLMKELEQAIAIQDKAQAEFDKTLSAQKAASAILNAAKDEADAITMAIIALRRGPITDTHRQNIVNDARNAVKESKKEKPVA